MRVRQRHKTEKKQEDYFAALVNEGAVPPKVALGGILKADVRSALKVIDRDTDDLVDVVYALLDDKFPNPFNPTYSFAHGAATAHIACYVGIFVRHSKKLDREGRDYWIKPLREVGVIEAVTYVPKTQEFVTGHLTAKSPCSAYRIDPKFIEILVAKKQKSVQEYFTPNHVASRLMLQSRAVEYVVSQRGRGDHFDLIELAQQFYVPNFLSEFEVCYVDNSDGDRISDEEKAKLKSVGINLALNDVFPDIILAAPDGKLWFVEAVTSDGEVDEIKFVKLNKFCQKHGKVFGGATTCYLTWKAFAARQDRLKNLAVGSFVWIASDPSKHLLVKAE